VAENENDQEELSRNDALQKTRKIFKVFFEFIDDIEDYRNVYSKARSYEARDFSMDVLSLIYFYSKKHQATFDIASSIAADYLDREECPPFPINKFLIDLLRGKIERPKRQGKRKNFKNHYRNIAIRFAFWILISSGWDKKTRNDASNHKDSAIDIISESLSEFGYYLSYSGVREALTDDFIKNMDSYDMEKEIEMLINSNKAKRDLKPKGLLSGVGFNSKK